MMRDARQEARIVRLEAQVAYLAEQLGVRPGELEAHAAPDVPAEARRLAEAGKKIKAIKVYREATGASLAEAKRAIEAISPFP
ncbi:ribosomal protein L7/L12 [Sciscionella sediminilitoris]|uniref:ribosomal protein L7/L12 n=1 Tax=Sciscionella sediminilitoris TaxID=1445613 RepID=UPI00068CCDDB|nr:ribosomal protein L7/L12 [Sciscionella sp. SE31]